MATRVRGQFDGFEGTAHLDGDDPSKCSAQLTLQATSIQTRNHRRDNHLRGSFLEADTYPTISFTSTNVEQFDETSYQVTGDLTIRGVAKRVTLNFELADAEKRPTG
jgi:polyisoprenoid-binding protein YceI